MKRRAGWPSAMTRFIPGWQRWGWWKPRVKVVHTVGELTEKYLPGWPRNPQRGLSTDIPSRNLEEHFGKGCDVASIGPAEADGFKAWIAEHEKLSPATVGAQDRCGPHNLAEGGAMGSRRSTGRHPGSTQTDDRRKRFIARDTIQKVLDNRPDDQWRLIVVLSRFGGVTPV